MPHGMGYGKGSYGKGGKGMKSNRKGAVGGVRKGSISSTPFKDSVVRTGGARR